MRSFITCLLLFPFIFLLSVGPLAAFVEDPSLDSMGIPMDGGFRETPVTNVMTVTAVAGAPPTGRSQPSSSDPGAT